MPQLYQHGLKIGFDLQKHCIIFFQVAKILYCFATTFRKVPKEMKEHNTLMDQELVSTFSVSLEFKEDDGKGNLTTCPKDKNMFKFRSNHEKKIIINVSQTGDKELTIERYNIMIYGLVGGY